MPLHEPNRLAPADFRAQVLALEPVVAVFDCDGTLWAGDAGSSFMRWSMTEGLLSQEKIEWLEQRYELYKRGEVSELAICGEMVQVYAGIDVETIRLAAAEFFAKQIEPHIFPDMLALVRELQRREAVLWAVSSTCDWVIEEGLRRFGIDGEHVLATCVSVRDGVATDQLLDVPTDEGKVASLARVGITQPDAVFGNSVHDAAMLAIARRAFPVNPSPALLERSAREGWAVFQPVVSA